MQPILFGTPYTSDKTCNRLLSLFGSFTLLSPIKPATEDHRITSVVPESVDPALLQNMIKTYQAIAGDFNGGGKYFIPGRTEQIPFYNETLTSHIKSQVLHAPDSKKANNNDALIANCILLAVAKMYEQENQSVYSDLTTIDRLQTNVIRALRGDAEDNVPPVSQQPPPLRTIPDNLIQAWLKMAPDCVQGLADKDQYFYLITDKSVHEYVQEMSHTRINLYELPLSGPLTKQTGKTLTDTIKTISKADPKSFTSPSRDITRQDDTPAYTVSLSVIPDADIEDSLNDFTGKAIHQDENRKTKTDTRHTVFAFFDNITDVYE